MIHNIKIFGMNCRDIDRVYNFIHLRIGLRNFMTLDTSGNLRFKGKIENAENAILQLGYKYLFLYSSY